MEIAILQTDGEGGGMDGEEEIKLKPFTTSSRSEPEVFHRNDLQSWSRYQNDKISVIEFPS